MQRTHYMTTYHVLWQHSSHIHFVTSHSLLSLALLSELHFLAALPFYTVFCQPVCALALVPILFGSPPPKHTALSGSCPSTVCTVLSCSSFLTVHSKFSCRSSPSHQLSLLHTLLYCSPYNTFYS